MFVYYAALLILVISLFDSGRTGKVSAGLMGILALIVSILVNFYKMPFKPGSYVQNPYNDMVLRLFVEPALVVFGLSIFLAYFYVLIYYFRE